MTKVATLRGLKLNPTMEGLIKTGRTYDFTDLEIYTSAAKIFRNSWEGSQLDPVGSLLDEDHDDRHEKVMAVLSAFAEQEESRRAQRRDDNAEMSRNHLPQWGNEASVMVPDVDSVPSHRERDVQAVRRTQFKQNTFSRRHDIARARAIAHAQIRREMEMNRRRFADVDMPDTGGASSSVYPDLSPPPPVGPIATTPRGY